MVSNPTVNNVNCTFFVTYRGFSFIMYQCMACSLAKHGPGGSMHCVAMVSQTWDHPGSLHLTLPPDSNDTSLHSNHYN